MRGFGEAQATVQATLTGYKALCDAPPTLNQKGLRMTRLSGRRRRVAGLVAVIAIIASADVDSTCASAQAGSPDYAALVAAPDRSDTDRQADKRRDPLPFLAFAGLRPGMKVLDMGAGAGYSTELDARAVAPTGIVYAQNPPDSSERAKAAFAARLATPVMKNSVSMLRPFDDPLPADVHDLDAITFLFFYHDTTYMNVDRAQMDRKLFAALKPGGNPRDCRPRGQGGRGYHGRQESASYR
jgi:predicted methyltransferase